MQTRSQETLTAVTRRETLSFLCSFLGSRNCITVKKGLPTLFCCLRSLEKSKEDAMRREMVQSKKTPDPFSCPGKKGRNKEESLFAKTKPVLTKEERRAKRELRREKQRVAN